MFRSVFSGSTAGSVLQVLRGKSAVARLKAISHVARSPGIGTIAEFVESDAVIAKLREIGIDHAQGLGIASPMPLEDIGRERLKSTCVPRSLSRLNPIRRAMYVATTVWILQAGYVIVRQGVFSSERG